MIYQDKQERARLQDFFRQVHEDPPPPFEKVMIRGSERAAPGWRWAVVGAATTLVLLTLVVLEVSAPKGQAPEEVEALAVAQAISTWESPLDFLLETPGEEVFDTPTIISPVPDVPGISDLNNKEKSS
jgi:hypothetical protein